MIEREAIKIDIEDLDAKDLVAENFIINWNFCG